MRLCDARDALSRLASQSVVAEGTVRLDLGAEVARLALDSPRTGNAVTVRMMAELADAVVALQDWEGAALVVEATGGRAFCSGGNLRDVRRVIDSPGRARTMALAMGRVLDSLLALPVTSVADVHGLAIGGGAELATAVDFRVLGPHGRLHFVHGRLGIAPGWGGAGRLVEHIGRRRALQVLHEGRALGPDEAAQIGLAEGARSVEEVLAPVLALDPAAARALKLQVVAARPVRSIGDEAEAFAAVWGGPAHRAALRRLARHSR